MTPVEVLLQFVTVFLGAFLAFVIENVRERRRLRGWVKRYLEQLYSDLQENTAAQEEGVRALRESTKAYQRFAEAGPDVPAPQKADAWDALLGMSYRSNDNFKILLEGDALRVLPAEVVRAVANLQKVSDANGVLDRLLTDLHGRYVVPVALAKTWPPSEHDRAALAYFKRVADMSLAYQERLLAAVREVQKALERRHLAP